MEKTCTNRKNDVLTLPISIKEDNKYRDTIKDRFDKMLSEFSGAEFTELKKFSKKILESIDCYYQGQVERSFIKIDNMIKELMKDEHSSLCFSRLDQSFVQKNSSNEIQWFRARANDCYRSFSADEMYHVPFSQRGSCGSGRYNIPGIPCLYLGNSSYVCWLEMNSISDDRLCVSPFVLDNDMRFFNIAIPSELLSEFAYNRAEFLFLMKIFLLETATSVHIDSPKRQFHSEYIVSQNIMRSCMKNGLDGILYYSTHAEDNVFNLVVGINAVVFMEYKKNCDISDTCKTRVKCGDSVNFAMFKNLLPSQTNKKYDLAIDHSSYTNLIGNMTHHIPYMETKFYEFDRYIFANWKKN